MCTSVVGVVVVLSLLCSVPTVFFCLKGQGYSFSFFGATMTTTGSSSEHPAGGGSSEGELYCICHGRDNGQFMYQCDVCGEWYHGVCTGLSAYEVEHKASENVVLCPDCCIEHVPLSDLELMQRRVLRNEIVPGARGIILKKIDLQNHSDPERRKRFSLLLTEALCSVDIPSNVEERRTIAGRRAEAIERVIYETAHCDAAGKSYRLRTRSVLIAIQESSSLRERVMNGECSVDTVAASEPSTLSVAQNQVSRRRLAEKLRQTSADDFSENGYSSNDDGGSSSASATKRSSPGGGESKAKKRRSRLASADVVWDGVVERNEKSTHGPCSVSGQYVSGTENLHRLVPEHIMFAGRFELDELLDYLHQLSHSTSRKRGVLLLEPRSSHDAVHYNAMYRHFMDKKRAGYLQRAPGFDGTPNTTDDEGSDNGTPKIERSPLEAEELYMVPLQRGAILPRFLNDDPFTNKDALATESSHPRLLLVVVARNTTIAEDSRLFSEGKTLKATSVSPSVKKEDNSSVGSTASPTVPSSESGSASAASTTSQTPL